MFGDCNSSFTAAYLQIIFWTRVLVSTSPALRPHAHCILYETFSSIGVQQQKNAVKELHICSCVHVCLCTFMCLALMHSIGQDVNLYCPLVECISVNTHKRIYAHLWAFFILKSSSLDCNFGGGGCLTIKRPVSKILYRPIVCVDTYRLTWRGV